MTYSKARMHGPRARQPRTLLEAYSLEADRLCELLGVDGRERWPDPKYRDAPELFCREVLGVEPWGDETHGQIGMLCGIRDHRRSAYRAGRKVSKSCTIGVAALWWFCSYYDAQVVMSSTTARQVDEVLWDEVRKLHDRSQRGLDPKDPALRYAQELGHTLGTRAIDGEPRLLARSGLAVGFRRVAGFTAREGVAAQGKSGVHLLYLLDEASGIPQAIIDAIIGNMAASGCKLALFGNPTTTEGEFYDAFGKKRKTEDNPGGYYTMTISSEESPNIVQRREVIPGLASTEWLEEREREWGRESVLFKVHVQGIHVEVEAGKIVSLQLIKEAEDRWNAEGEHAVPATGVLHIGIDPALAASGDEAVFVARRGFRVLEIRAHRGLSEAGHVAVLEDMLREHREPGEIAVVNVDALGDVGAKVKVELTIYWRAHESEMVLCAIRGSDNAVRNPEGYIRVRDELWGSVHEWLRDGGAIPENAKLERDLHAPSWVPGDLKQRKQATKKDVIKKLIGRSPDHGDGLCLACWDNTRAAKWAATTVEEKPKGRMDEPAAQGMDPYAGADVWRT